MSYGNKTRFYKIPFPKNGDIITEEQEKLKMSIIDNLLYAATFGANKCLIEEGIYSYNEEKNSVIIKPAKDFSLLGIINYRLFMSDKEITIPVIYKNATNYVYIKYKNTLEQDVSAFKIEVEPMILEDSDKTFLFCKIDTRNNDVKIITDVEDKVLAKNILAHTKDTTNPHGSILYQNTLNVKELNVQGNRLYSSIYDDIISKGANGNIYEIPKNFIPVFVTAFGDSIVVGNISWKINDDNNVVVYNSGVQDKTIHLKIEGYYK